MNEEMLEKWKRYNSTMQISLAEGKTTTCSQQTVICPSNVPDSANSFTVKLYWLWVNWNSLPFVIPSIVIKTVVLLDVLVPISVALQKQEYREHF